MTHNRRSFLKHTGMLASGIALAGIGCAGNNSGGDAGDTTSNPDSAASKVAGHTLAQFGLQLYTLRDDLPKDVKGVLQQVSSFGYKQIEGYEGGLGLWWGMTNKELKAYLDSIGLTMVSSHCNVTQDLDRKAAEAAEIGMKYLIQPWLGAKKTLDEYKKSAEDFNKYGEICKKNGIRFAYHNHGYSFEPLEGQVPQDIFMQNTDPSTVDFEMDIYWVVVPGADPVAWLQKYPNRFRLCHVKDRLKDAAPGDPDTSTEVGAGSIDFKKILRVAEDNGMQYFIVEQERYDNGTPLEAAKKSADYLKTLAI